MAGHVSVHRWKSISNNGLHIRVQTLVTGVAFVVDCSETLNNSHYKYLNN
jgi:protoheme ferro-lyase